MRVLVKIQITKQIEIYTQKNLANPTYMCKGKWANCLALANVDNGHTPLRQFFLITLLKP